MIQPIFTYLWKELLVPLLPPKQAGKEDSRTINGEKRADAVKLWSENLEYYQSKGELAECGPNIGALESSLRGANLHKLIVGEDDRSCSVEAQAIPISGMGLLSMSTLYVEYLNKLVTSNILCWAELMIIEKSLVAKKAAIFMFSELSHVSRERGQIPRRPTEGQKIEGMGEAALHEGSFEIPFANIKSEGILSYQQVPKLWRLLFSFKNEYDEGVQCSGG